MVILVFLAVLVLLPVLLLAMIDPLARLMVRLGMHRGLVLLRLLQRRKIVLFSVMGVAIGIWALVIVTSVMGGFARDLQGRIRGIASHVVVTRPGRYVGNPDALLDVIRRVPHVVAAAPHVEGVCNLYVNGRLYREGVQFIGIDPAREMGGGGAPGATDLGSYLVDGSKGDFRLGDVPPPYPGMLVGSELMSSAWYLPGYSFTLVTFKEKPGSTVPFDTPQRRFTVTGRFKTRMVEYDTGLVYMSLASAQEFLGIGRAVTHLVVRLDDVGRVAAAKRAIRDAFDAAGDLRVETRGLVIRSWDEDPDKQVLLQAVNVEKIAMGFVLFLVIVVAGFNIIAILTLLVDIKTRDIGVLRAVGMTARSVCGLFLLNGALIGIIGSVLGVLVGLASVYGLKWIQASLEGLFGVQIFPADVYYLDAIPTAVSYPAIAMVVVASLVVSLVFSAYPAWKAARLDPVEAIRYE